MVKRKKRIIMYMAIIVLMTLGMGKIGEVALAENQVNVEKQRDNISVVNESIATSQEYFEIEITSENPKEASIKKFKQDIATGITEVVIPTIVIDNNGNEYTVTAIGNQAFSYCSSLTSIEIPNTVKTIGSRAFEECLRLITITIPDSVTVIRSEAFSNCIGLTTITIPKSVTCIEEFTFFRCYSLKTVVVHDTLTAIARNAFTDSVVSNLIFICQNKEDMDISADVASNVSSITVYRIAADVDIETDYSEIKSYELVGKTLSLEEIFQAKINDGIIYT